MAEYLIIGGKNAALHSLAVAADIAAATESQVDIAVAPAQMEIARLGKTPRRIIEITSPAAPDFSLESLKTIPSGGWKGMLSFARTTARKAASSAREQFGQYRELAEELRLVRYDATLDLSGDAAGIIAARIADSEKVWGFASENIPDAAPGASLFYHDSRAVSRSLSRREQCRRLAADFLGYSPPPIPEWSFIDQSRSSDFPAAPFVVFCGKIPAPFMAVLRDAGLPLYESDSPADILAAAQQCAFAAGNGIAAEIAAAAGAKTLYIGAKKDSPPEAIAAESPSVLSEEIANIARQLSAAAESESNSQTSDASSESSGMKIAKSDSEFDSQTSESAAAEFDSQTSESESESDSRTSEDSQTPELSETESAKPDSDSESDSRTSESSVAKSAKSDFESDSRTSESSVAKTAKLDSDSDSPKAAQNDDGEGRGGLRLRR